MPISLIKLPARTQASLAYALSVILVAILCTYYQELSLYQRESIEQGQIWRLLSGHLAHLNNKHLILNLIAWLIIFFLGFHYLSLTRWVALLIILSLSISAGLYYFVPTVISYGGLSGVLHGYFAFILVEWIRNKQKIAWLVLLLLILKVLMENFVDGGLFSEQYLDIRVISEVHLIGVFVGIFTALLAQFKDSSQNV